MKWSPVAIGIASVAVVCSPVGAQQPVAGRIGEIRTAASELAGRQTELDNSLHQRAVAMGGKLIEARDADSADLAGDLPSLAMRSDEVLLVHSLITYGGVSATGDSVQTQYDVQVLRSWKGTHKAGDVVRVSVLAGGLLFPDGTQAAMRVNGFSRLRDGGRYVLFLHSAPEEGQSTPNFLLVGGGVQGAFLLNDEKVLPVYQKGDLAKAYDKQDVPKFLAELDALIPGQR